MINKNKFILPNKPESFLLKVMEAYPEDFVTLRKIIGLGKILYSENPLMTAAVVNTKPHTLIFGKPFIEENIKTIDDCVYLLSHELTHLLLGHFAKDIREIFIDKNLNEYAINIIFDCQVNASCYHSLNDNKYFEFIKRFYSKTEMPECFFRYDGEPPSHDLKELHKKLYSTDGITNEELIKGLLNWMGEHDEKIKQALHKLLGNHNNLGETSTDQENDDNSRAENDSLIESYAKDLKDIINKKEGKKNVKTEEKNGRSAGKSGLLRQLEVILNNIDYSKTLGKKLNKTYVIHPSSKLHSAIEGFFPKKQTRTPVPNFYDRRTVALHSVGKLPVFHKNKETSHKVFVPCYVDVSGSQNHVVGAVFSAVTRQKKKIGNKVFCFSTEVSETSLDELKRGKYKTTGGTDFNPVVLHILKNKFRKAIILTDGQAGLNIELIEKLIHSGILIKVGWTVKYPDKEPLSKIAKEEFYLFEKDNGN